MSSDSNKNKAVYIFLSIFAVVAAGVGGYLIWDYNRIKKINSTIVTEEEADAIAAKALE